MEGTCANTPITSLHNASLLDLQRPAPQFKTSISSPPNASSSALLPAPVLNPTSRFDTEYRFYPRVPCRLRKRYDAPTRGSPIQTLPDDLLLDVFRHFDWEDLVTLRMVSRRWAEVVLTPALHVSMSISSSRPTPLLERALKSVQHLHLNLFPYPRSEHSLLALLDKVPPDQLRTLSLPFSSRYTEGDLGAALKTIGSKLERLDLKGSGIEGTEWLDAIGANGRGVSYLDLSFTSISDFSPSAHTFRNLRSLRLANCTSLSEKTLSGFLAMLPGSIERLDLSRLDNVTFAALWGLRVGPSALREVRVVGIDHLTRRDVRRLKDHWAKQRREAWSSDSPDAVSQCTSESTVAQLAPESTMSHYQIDINIVHSAILESEDEEGYRQFIGEIANGTIPPGVGLGLGLGSGVEMGKRSWVEVGL